MSRWRLAVRALHELGGEADTYQIADRMVDCTKAAGQGMLAAKRFGLVAGDGKRGGGVARWRLTRLGCAYMENRVTAHQNLRHGEPYENKQRIPRFTPTWLASLPQDIRIEQRQLTEEAA